jgi:hypothetical protein
LNWQPTSENQVDRVFDLASTLKKFSSSLGLSCSLSAMIVLMFLFFVSGVEPSLRRDFRA